MSYIFSIIYGPLSTSFLYLIGNFSSYSLRCASHSEWSSWSSFAFTLLRISSASPITDASVCIFLFISAASTSNWRILAFLANLCVLPVTLSENLAPIVIRRSHSDTPKLEVLVPCIPSIPV